jgi:Spy/CpxP family protein refolding chaperone
MKNRLIVVGLTMIMSLGVTYVFADDHPKGGGHEGTHQHGVTHQHESHGAGKALDLTPEQRAKFKELRRRLEDETAQLRGALLTKKLELRSLWRNPKADPKAITDKEKELRDVQNQMRDKVIQHRLEARKFLTPEQISEMGPAWGMGRGFGRRHRTGEGHDMEHGMGQGMGSGMGHGMGRGMGQGMGHGMGSGMGGGMGMCK